MSKAESLQSMRSLFLIDWIMLLMDRLCPIFYFFFFLFFPSFFLSLAIPDWSLVFQFDLVFYVDEMSRGKGVVFFFFNLSLFTILLYNYCSLFGWIFWFHPLIVSGWDVKAIDGWTA